MIRPLELGLIAGSLCLFFFVNAKEAGRGPEGSYWDLRADDSGQARLALEVRRPGHRWRADNPRPWAGFRGIDAAGLRRSGPLEFEYVTPVGVIAAQGESDGRRARGSFVFRPDPAFQAGLQAAGYERPSEETVFEMMMHGLTLEFAQGLRASGLDATLRDLVDLSVHGVALDFVRQTRSLGFSRLTARDFIEMRIHGVSLELLKALQAAGYDLPVRDIVDLRIHGVSPEYLGQLAQAGYGQLKAQEVVELRIHGVGPELAARARSLGYGFSPRELIEMRNHGVDARYLEKLADSGFQKLSAEKIIKLRTHGIE